MGVRCSCQLTIPGKGHEWRAARWAARVDWSTLWSTAGRAPAPAVLGPAAGQQGSRGRVRSTATCTAAEECIWYCHEGTTAHCLGRSSSCCCSSSGRGGRGSSGRGWPSACTASAVTAAARSTPGSGQQSGSTFVAAPGAAAQQRQPHPVGRHTFDWAHGFVDQPWTRPVAACTVPYTPAAAAGPVGPGWGQRSSGSCSSRRGG